MDDLRRTLAGWAAIYNQPSWHNKRRTLGDAIACFLGLHRTAHDGHVGNPPLYVERCSCGATRLNGRHGWIREKWWSGPREGN